jgi:hypothetical protein
MLGSSQTPDATSSVTPGGEDEDDGEGSSAWIIIVVVVVVVVIGAGTFAGWRYMQSRRVRDRSE